LPFNNIKWLSDYSRLWQVKGGLRWNGLNNPSCTQLHTHTHKHTHTHICIYIYVPYIKGLLRRTQHRFHFNSSYPFTCTPRVSAFIKIYVHTYTFIHAPTPRFTPCNSTQWINMASSADLYVLF